MPCFSLTESKNSCHRSTFARAGLRSAITDIKDGGTTMHCWVPQSPNPSKRNLLLIHGLGVNAMWQFVDLLRHVTPHFNVYVPDLLFFGESFTTRPDRSESFQAECVMRVMEAHSVRRLSLLGLSYGGFVGYSLAAKYKEAVERVVICCAAVCLEEKDIREGVFPISDLDEAASILVPQTPQKLRELIKYTFFKPPPLGLIPSCLLMDFIEAMYTEHVKEQKELIMAVPKNRKLSDLPKIPQPTLILWGEHDQVFPLEFAYKLKRHLGENAELVVIKDAGHAINVQKPKEYYNHIKSFLLDMQQPSANKHQQHSKPLQSLT
ncbi:PREDICTED: lipase 3 isoform X1 [Prunus mume]|uniref:Lipase 3 isoform X1 n=1 Tax=Prunus mume TaxID=102107 RepID=A0ABM0N4J2_PRUMU|nr:PREDICTED: lipase 3 isoform X1 [Prunus mume]